MAAARPRARPRAWARVRDRLHQATRECLQIAGFYTVAALPVIAGARDPLACAARSCLEGSLAALFAVCALRAIALLAAQVDAARGRRALGGALAAFGAAAGVALGATLITGAAARHHPARFALLAVLALAGALGGTGLARAALGQLSSWAACGALALGLLASLIHGTVLTGLYPTFHLALWLGSALALAVAARSLRPRWLPALARLGGFASASVALFALLSNVPLGSSALPLAAAPEELSERSAVLAELEALALAPLPTAEPALPLPAAARPARAQRVILLLVDTLRADVLLEATASPEAAARHRLPHLFALAARSERFTRAYAHASITHVSTSALLHGLVRADAARRPDQHLAYALAHSPRQVQTALVGWSYFRAGGEPVDEENFRTLRGFERTSFYEFHEQEQVVTKLRATLDTFDPARPAFVLVHLACMHDPGYDGAPISRLVPHRQRYMRSLAWLDGTVGALLRTLDDGVPTALLLTSDHGEGLADHELDFHGVHTYEEEIRVPLWLSAPGVAGAAYDQLTVHGDVAPTVADLLDVARHPRWLGRSLFDAGVRAQAYAHVQNTSGREVSLTDGAHKIMFRSTEHVLAYYDLAHDPHERMPLSAQHDAHSRALLRALMLVRGDLFDQVRRDALYTKGIARVRARAGAGEQPSRVEFLEELARAR